MCKLTVILPCAGKGERLGLPYSKEIYSFEKDKSLIDYTFDLFSAYNRSDLHFAITITEDKTDIIQHLSKYKHRFNISFTYFNPEEKDVPGSIKSTKHLLGEKNLVLLPDTILKINPSIDIVTTICNTLDNSEFAFLYKKEDSPSILTTRGALYVKGNEVVDYDDKPCDIGDRFNAYWGGLAFTKRVFDDALNTIQHFYTSTKPSFKETVLYKARAIEIDDYIDLGTWDSIKTQIYNTYVR